MNNASDISSNNEEVLPNSTEINSFSENNDTVKKDPEAFRTISEVADEIHVPQHVLRFWETRFKQLQPVKSSGGRRYYRVEDIILLKYISELLYIDGYTIKGVQKLLDDDLSKITTNVEDELNEAEAGTLSEVITENNVVENDTIQEVIQNESTPHYTQIDNEELIKLKKEKVFLVNSLKTILLELQELRKIIVNS